MYSTRAARGTRRPAVLTRSVRSTFWWGLLAANTKSIRTFVSSDYTKSFLIAEERLDGVQHFLAVLTVLMQANEWTSTRSISARGNKWLAPVSTISPCARGVLLRQPFFQGEPGSMYNVSTPARDSHRRIALAMNSGPLSLRMRFGNNQSENTASRPAAAIGKRTRSHRGTGC